MKEIRARLGLIQSKLEEMAWLEGLYMHGAELLEQPLLKRLGFIVLYRGLTQAPKRRAAQDQLQELLKAVLPVELSLQFTSALGLGDLLQEGNPAAKALLGHAEAIYVK